MELHNNLIKKTEINILERAAWECTWKYYNIYITIVRRK